MSQSSNPPKKSKIRKILIGFLFPILGIALGYGLGKMQILSAGSSSPKMFYLSYLPLFILVIFLTIAWHELGHLLAGLTVGFDFHSYTVGPLLVQKQGGKTKLSFNNNLNTYGGLTLCLPRDSYNLVPRFIRYIAGGPAFSLFLGVGALVFYYGGGFHQGQDDFFWFLFSSFWVFMGYTSLLIFLVTIIPAKSGPFYTDGARLRTFLKGGPQAQLEVTLLSAISKTLAGLRPRDLNHETLEEALALPVQSSFRMFLHNYLFLIYLDREDPERARRELQAVMEEIDQLPEAIQGNILHLRAYFEARYDQDTEQARVTIEQVKPGPFTEKYLENLAHMALAAQEGNKALLSQYREKLALSLPKAMEKGLAHAVASWAESIKIGSVY